MSTPKVNGYRTSKAQISNIREGDTILADGAAVVVRAARIDRGATSYYYTLFDGAEERLFTGPASLVIWKLTPIPEVGQGGSQRVGSDRYPFTVIGVSPSGHEITIQRDKPVHISGSFQNGDYHYDFDQNPNGAILKGRWSTKFGKYIVGGSSVSIGTRSYYQDPHH